MCPCRWLDDGDGTAADLNAGVRWELKTGDGSIDDKDDTCTWGDASEDPERPGLRPILAFNEFPRARAPRLVAGPEHEAQTVDTRDLNSSNGEFGGYVPHILLERAGLT